MVQNQTLFDNRKILHICLYQNLAIGAIGRLQLTVLQWLIYLERIPIAVQK